MSIPEQIHKTTSAVLDPAHMYTSKLLLRNTLIIPFFLTHKMNSLFAVIHFMAQYIAASTVSRACPSPSIGLVDLGYAKHIPTYINTTASGERVAIYKNVRFANAPTGDLRFRKPDTNLPVQDGVQEGKASMSDSTCISTASHKE